MEDYTGLFQDNTVLYSNKQDHTGPYYFARAPTFSQSKFDVLVQIVIQKVTKCEHLYSPCFIVLQRKEDMNLFA